MRASKQPSKFRVEVPAGEILVIRNLGEKIGNQIGRARISTVVELRTNGSEGGGKCDVVADKLIGVFNADSHGPMFVGVIGDSELGRPGVGHSDQGFDPRYR